MSARWGKAGAASLLLAFVGVCSAQYDYTWRTGRASYYGTDGWSIHKGNCGFGYIAQDQPAGWDTVALSDQFPGFAGSCGRCYEVKCDPRNIKDGYGKAFDRTAVCHDPEKSLLVRVVDSCPCHYPSNYYSNKRWCCGDADHMDMSIWAFEKLTDKKWGVMAIKYRAVPCNYVPPTPAPSIANPTQGEHWSQTNNFMHTGNMQTPKIWNHQQTDKMVQDWSFGDPTGSSSNHAGSAATATASASASGGSGASATASSFSSSSGGGGGGGGSASSFSSSSSWASSAGSSSSSSSSSGGGSAGLSSLSSALGFQPSVHSFDGNTNSTATAAAGAAAASSPAPSGAPSPAPSSGTPGGSGSSGAVFADKLQPGWWDASYSATVNWQAGRFGRAGGNAVCADLFAGGALAVGHAPGAFQGAETLEWWVKADKGQPQVTVNIGGGARYCSPVTVASLPVLETRAGGWAKFAVHLGSFGGSYGSFQGCGGAGTWDLTKIEFKSAISSRQTLCLDSLALLPRGGASASASASASAGASSSRRLLAGRRAAASA